MKFPLLFTRYKGAAPAGGKNFGAEGFPFTDAATSQPRQPNPKTDDQVLYARMTSTNGWPASRIILASRYTGGGALTAVNVTANFFENSMGIWVALGATSATVTPGSATVPGVPVYFDVPSLLEIPNIQANLDQNSTGSIAIAIIVGDPGALPAGRYDFAAAADLTTKPF
jgi:hypothetical protein